MQWPRFKCGHHHERSVLLLEHCFHFIRALHEAIFHGAEQREELGDITEEPRTKNTICNQEERLRRK